MDRLWKIIIIIVKIKMQYVEYSFFHNMLPVYTIKCK